MTTPKETEADSQREGRRGGGRKGVAILSGVVVAVVGYLIVKVIWNAVLGFSPSLAAYLVVGIIGDIAIVIGAIAAGIWVYRAIRRPATP